MALERSWESGTTSPDHKVHNYFVFLFKLYDAENQREIGQDKEVFILGFIWGKEYLGNHN